MKTRLSRAIGIPVAVAILAALLSACGGGVGDSSLPVTKQLTVVEGPVAGFGSVIVDGVRFDDSKATIVDDDGQLKSRADLRLGTVLRVEGVADDSTGSATRMVLVPSLLGKVDALDPGAGTLVILGQTVVTDTNTAFDGTTGLPALALGDVLRVYGLVAGDGSFAATLVQKLNGPLLSYQIRGKVVTVNTALHTFTVGALTIDYSAAQLRPSGAEPFVDALVKISADQPPVAGVLSATKLTIRSARTDYQTDGYVKLKGIIDAAPDDTGNTTVSGVPVSFANAVLQGSGQLVAGQRVEIKGYLFEGVVQVIRVEFEGWRASQIGGRNELYGVIADFVSAGQFTVNGVAVDAREASFENGTLAALANSVYVEIKGNLRTDSNGTILVATRVEFKPLPGAQYHDGDQADASREFYGVIQNFVSLANFTLNGHPVDASGARIENGSASDLHDGVYAEIKGTMQGDKLIASEIEIKAMRSSLPAEPAPAPIGDAASGATLYAASCSGCHGSDPKANYRDVLEGANNGTKIANLIAKDEGGMGFLASLLSTQQIQDIAAYLGAPDTAGSLPPPPPPPPSTIPAPVDAANGQVLYAGNCVLCHGTDPSLNTNNVLNGADNDAVIATAIGGNTGGMGGLAGVLSAAQLKDIAAYLGTVTAAPPPTTTTPPPTTTTPPPPPPPSTPTPDPVHGKALYSTAPAGVSLACSACHGTSPDTRARRGTSPALLTSAFNNVGGMNAYIGKYSEQDLIDLAAYLAGPTY